MALTASRIRVGHLTSLAMWTRETVVIRTEFQRRCFGSRRHVSTHEQPPVCRPGGRPRGALITALFAGRCRRSTEINPPNCPLILFGPLSVRGAEPDFLPLRIWFSAATATPCTLSAHTDITGFRVFCRSWLTTSQSTSDWHNLAVPEVDHGRTGEVTATS